MSDEQNQVVVESKFMWGRLVLPIFLLAGMAVTVFVVRNFPQVEQRATVINISPTPLIALSPTPLDLPTPYIRLYAAKNKYPFQTTVPVIVYLNTGGLEASEVHLSLTYDPEMLTIGQNDIRPEDVFTSFGLESFSEGKLEMTLFVPPDLDYPSVKTDAETKIAVLNFKTGSESSDKTEINFLYSQSSIEGTSLIEAGKERGVLLQNALKNVSGVSFEISP